MRERLFSGALLCTRFSMPGPDPYADTAEARGRRGSSEEGDGSDPSQDDTQQGEGGADPGPVEPDADLTCVPDRYYQLEHEFARGGLGRILRARDRRLDRTVAVKELLSTEPKAEGRFVREALITARLQHPSIVPVHEAGRWPTGQRFYAMKLVEGRTLASALEAARTREDRLALLPHVIDVAEAVAYAHSQGILHRDLKPGNVMVGPFGETVVIDWGLAKDLWAEAGAEAEAPGSQSLPTPPRRGDAEPPQVSGSGDVYTSDGMVVGTPPYMPPEQASARGVDERADVYALGAMLYHVLCGRRPYQNVPAREVLKAVVSGPPKPVQDLAPDLPRDLVAIVEKAMARDPDQRYPSAKEMASELRRFSTGQLVSAHDYSPAEILGRFIRRNLGAVSVFAVASLLLIGFGVWSFEALRQERDRARAAAEQEHASSQQLILARAAHMLQSDPTESLAWLDRLDDPGRPGAPSIASDAQFRGVARWVDAQQASVIDVSAASPDGRWLAWSGVSGTIRLLDLRAERFHVLEGHSDRVVGLAFHPEGDRLASSSYDDTVRVWRLPSGSDPGVAGEPTVLRGHEGDVKALTWLGGDRLASVSTRELIVWGPKGRMTFSAAHGGANRGLAIGRLEDRVVTGGHGTSVWIWDLQNEAPARVIECDPERVEAVAASRDGRYVACGGAQGTVTLVDLVEDGRRSIQVTDLPLLSLAFSPDGRSLVSTHFEGQVWLHSLEDRGAPRSRPVGSASQRVVAGSFSPDGQWLATAGWDGLVQLTHASTTDTRRLMGHVDTVSTVTFSGDGRWLVSGSWDGTARIWKVDPPRSQRLIGHSVGVHAVAFSPDGAWVASGGHDDKVIAWHLASGLRTEFVGHEDHVFRVQFHPSGAWLASSSDDRTVRLWQVEGGATQVLSGHTADVEELSFSADGRWLASAGEDARTFLWDLKTLKEDAASSGKRPAIQGQPLVGHTDAVTDVEFSPTAAELATSGRGGTVWLWTLPDGDGAPTGRKLLQLEGPAWALAFGPEGSELAVVGQDRLTVTDVREGRVEMEVTGLTDARIVAYAPTRDVNLIAVASSGNAWWLCERTYGRCRAMPDHGGSILDMTFHPSDRVLATGCADTTIRLWDLEREEFRSLRGHHLNVFDVAFSPDGERLVSGSADADVRVWPVELPPPAETLPEWLRAQTSYVAMDAPAVPSEVPRP